MHDRLNLPRFGIAPVLRRLHCFASLELFPVIGRIQFRSEVVAGDWISGSEMLKIVKSDCGTRENRASLKSVRRNSLFGGHFHTVAKLSNLAFCMLILQ